MKSLKKQLIFWLVGLLTVVGVMAGGVSFYFALQEANGLLDHQLRQIARSVDEGSQLPAMQARFNKENEQERARDFVIQVWVENAPADRPALALIFPEWRFTGFRTLSSQHVKMAGLYQ